MAITEDASTPVITTGSDAGTTTTSTKTIASVSFSPPANSMLVALVGGGWGNSATNAMVASVTDSTSGTWTAGPSAAGTDTAARGVAAIFYRYLPSAPGSITVTASITNMCGGRLLAVRVLNGAASTQSGAGSASVINAATASGTVNVTTTVTGSQVYGINDDSGSNTAYTASGSTSVLSGTPNGDFNDTADAIRLVAWKATNTTGTPGATTLGVTWATATKNNVVALEVLPLSATTATAVSATGVGTANNPTVTTSSSSPQAVAAHGVGAAFVATIALPTVLSFPAVPRDTSVELFLNSTWINVTSDVRDATGIDITRGRPNEASSSQPATCAMTFDNRSGNYSPRNPVGAYFGQIGRNTPIRVAVGLATDTFIRIAPNGWGRMDTGQNWTSVSSGTLVPADFQVGGAGTQSISIAGGYRYCYTASNSWADVDVAVTTALSFTTITGGSIFPGTIILRTSGSFFYKVQPRIDTTGHVFIGITFSDGTILAPFVDTGIIHSSSQSLRVRAQIEGNTIRGKIWPAAGNEPYSWLVLVFDTSLTFNGGIGVLSATDVANTNTYPVVCSYTNLKVRSCRFFGEVAAWPQHWDITGSDATAPIDAASILRRLAQGNASVQSTFRLGVLALSTPAVAYWPVEDDAGSATIASALNGPAMSVSDITKQGTQFAAYTAIPSSAPLPTVGASVWTGSIPTYGSFQTVQLRFMMHISSGGPDNNPIATLYVTGGAYAWRLKYYTGGGLGLQAFGSGGASVLDTGAIGFAVDGKDLLVSVELIASGNISWTIRTLEVGADTGLSFNGTLTGLSIGKAYQVAISEFGNLTSTTIGHIFVQQEVTDLFQLSRQLNAYVRETAGNRLTRLCNQLNLPLTFFGFGSTDTTKMGPQQVDTLMNLVNDCANADMGTMMEPKGDIGFLYRTRRSAYLQFPTATLNYASGQVAPPFDPIDDDQLTRNDITVTRQGGSSARAQLLSGRMSVLDPSLGGVGRYDTSVTINVASDSQLPDVAGWLLNLGTVDQTRYAKVQVRLESPQVATSTALSAAMLDLNIDDRFVIINPKSGQTPDTISQLVRGYSEHISNYEHSITINAAPEAPYATVVLDFGVKWDSSGSTLTAGVTSSATSLSVATTGAPWTTASGQMPISIVVAGERMTITAITGATSPQTFTVTRSVNGIVKSQAVNAVVRLFLPATLPL
jgi:hypothetical protein